MAARATRASPAEAVGPETAGPSVLTYADHDELAVTVAVAVRLEAEVFLFRLTDVVDTGIRGCEA